MNKYINKWINKKYATSGRKLTLKSSTFQTFNRFLQLQNDKCWTQVDILELKIFTNLNKLKLVYSLVESNIIYIRHLYTIHLDILDRQSKTFQNFNSFMTEILWKSMDWFLYNRDLRHERVKTMIFWNG